MTVSCSQIRFPFSRFLSDLLCNISFPTKKKNLASGVNFIIEAV